MKCSKCGKNLVKNLTGYWSHKNMSGQYLCTGEAQASSKLVWLEEGMNKENIEEIQ
tara:strand:- start:559 stop:726 length:168 start_codon:yes stop_codon:yes gene_type:complete